MAEAFPTSMPNFARALAYCLSYDRVGDSPDLSLLERLLSGQTMTADEERLANAVLLAQEALTSVPGDESARERLQRIAERSRSLGNPRVALVAGGATKIKQYVFESARLPEIRGASSLLDRLNLVAMRALFSSTDGEDRGWVEEIRQGFRNRYGKSPIECADCVIYANGGEFLAFAPTIIAPMLADEVEYLYTSETGSAHSIAVWQTVELTELAGGIDALSFRAKYEDASWRARAESLWGSEGLEAAKARKGFGELVAGLALRKLRRREGNPDSPAGSQAARLARAPIHWETFPFGQRCHSCEKRMASHSREVGDERYPFCEPCQRKRVEGSKSKRAWVTEFETLLGGESSGADYYTGPGGTNIRDTCQRRNWDGKALPDRPVDLEEIARRAVPSGYIGIIYADGNNMGALLEKLPTPDAYHQFADDVYSAVQQSVFGSLARHVKPVQTTRPEGSLWVYPFEILSIGGDDVFLIVPGNCAVAVATDIACGVEERLAAQSTFQCRELYEPEHAHRCPVGDGERVRVPQSNVAMSVGVVIASAHAPIFLLHDLVSQLLKSAKAYAKSLRRQRYLGGTVDFQAMKSIPMITSRVAEFREATLRRGDEYLTARPYTLLEMKRLMDTVRVLKAAGVPRSQLYALRRALGTGRAPSTVDYLYFTARLDETHRHTIRKALDETWCFPDPAPWRRKPGGWETILGDVIELYDFVDEGNG
jgi:CRISPR-associated protein Cmr2